MSTFGYWAYVRLWPSDNPTVCCNTAIRPESVRCVLIACDIKYVCLLVTTLDVAIHCNTTIRPEFVHYALVTCSQVFVYYSATTLDIVVCFDAAIRPKSVRYVLAVIRLLPICRPRLR